MVGVPSALRPQPTGPFRSQRLLADGTRDCACHFTCGSPSAIARSWRMRIGPVRRGHGQHGRPLPAGAAGPRELVSALGMYLKKHRARTWATRIAAALGLAPPPSPGRVEAENALALQSLGIDVMPLMAYRRETARRRPAGIVPAERGTAKGIASCRISFSDGSPPRCTSPASGPAARRDAQWRSRPLPRLRSAA